MLALIIIIAFKKSVSYWTCKFMQLKSSLRKVLTVFLILYMIAIESISQAQNSLFEVVRNGKKIGELTALKNINDDYTTLRVTTNVCARFIFEVMVETDAQSLFKNDRLCRLTSVKKVNGVEKTNNSVTQNNNGYLVKNIDGNLPDISEAITSTTISLYFNEPGNIKSIFSEMYLSYVPISCTKKNKYKVEMPDGSINYYYYKNGILVKVELIHTFFTINIILKSVLNKPPLSTQK